MRNIRSNLLKKLLIIVIFTLSAAALFAASGDTLNIGGTVPLNLTLNVTPAASIDNLALSTINGATTVDIASITVASNASAGWDLYIYSANDGSMLNADGDAITYTLTYASTASSAGAGGTTQAPTTAGLSYTDETNTSGDATGDLDITYTQSTAYAAGYYSDQLTLVLRAK